jgi:hypothetical protein
LDNIFRIGKKKPPFQEALKKGPVLPSSLSLLACCLLSPPSLAQAERVLLRIKE